MEHIGTLSSLILGVLLALIILGIILALVVKKGSRPYAIDLTGLGLRLHVEEGGTVEVEDACPIPEADRPSNCPAHLEEICLPHRRIPIHVRKVR